MAAAAYSVELIVFNQKKTDRICSQPLCEQLLPSGQVQSASQSIDYEFVADT